ncbi:MAG TPA: THUMP domain-containing protein [Thermoplasmata archaeon]|nr:THUMP domain-containing protein [Thermoplasmata archaeon]
MRAVIELSGEHPTLPRAEALAAIAAEGVELRSAVFGPGLLRIDASGQVEAAALRLGLAHLVSEEIGVGDFDSIRAAARQTDLGGRTFRVRASGVGVDVDTQSIEAALGTEFGRTGKVNLVRPDVEFRVLVGDEFILGRVVHRFDRGRLESRKVARRRFSLPISLHPKLARALVNLSRVPPGGTILDPFCGTGGIPLEASEMGLRVLAFDRVRRMVEGTRSTLRESGFSANVAVADAGQLPVRSKGIHAIATDPPYGRAASTRGEPRDRLYARAFEAFEDVLPEGRFASMVLPNESAIEIASTRLELVERHDLRVHRSLVRHFCVFVKA